MGLEASACARKFSPSTSWSDVRMGSLEILDCTTTDEQLCKALSHVVYATWTVLTYNLLLKISALSGLWIIVSIVFCCVVTKLLVHAEQSYYGILNVARKRRLLCISLRHFAYCLHCPADSITRVNCMVSNFILLSKHTQSFDVLILNATFVVHSNEFHVQFCNLSAPGVVCVRVCVCACGH